MIGSVIAAGCGLAATGTILSGMYDPNSPVFGSVIAHGPRQGRKVYLTFDDGPNPTATDRILEVLADSGIPAAFFMVGRSVRRYPGIARRVRAAGHEVGNHTQHHVKLHLRGPREVRRELSAAHDAILGTVGAAPRTFRAPHGYRNPFVQSVVRGLGYQVFGWSVGVWDSARPGAEVIRDRVRRKVRPGAIVLLHDGDGYDPTGDRTQTAEALPGIVRDLRDAGYEFGSPAELLRE